MSAKDAKRWSLMNLMANQPESGRNEDTASELERPIGDIVREMFEDNVDVQNYAKQYFKGARQYVTRKQRSCQKRSEPITLEQRKQESSRNSRNYTKRNRDEIVYVKSKLLAEKNRLDILCKRANMLFGQEYIFEMQIMVKEMERLLKEYRSEDFDEIIKSIDVAAIKEAFKANEELKETVHTMTWKTQIYTFEDEYRTLKNSYDELLSSKEEYVSKKGRTNFASAKSRMFQRLTRAELKRECFLMHCASDKMMNKILKLRTFDDELSRTIWKKCVSIYCMKLTEVKKEIKDIDMEAWENVRQFFTIVPEPPVISEFDDDGYSDYSKSPTVSRGTSEEPIKNKSIKIFKQRLSVERSLSPDFEQKLAQMMKKKPEIMEKEVKEEEPEELDVKPEVSSTQQRIQKESVVQNNIAKRSPPPTATLAPQTSVKPYFISANNGHPPRIYVCRKGHPEKTPKAEMSPFGDMDKTSADKPVTARVSHTKAFRRVFIRPAASTPMAKVREAIAKVKEEQREEVESNVKTPVLKMDDVKQEPIDDYTQATNVRPPPPPARTFRRVHILPCPPRIMQGFASMKNFRTTPGMVAQAQFDTSSDNPSISQPTMRLIRRAPGQSSDEIIPPHRRIRRDQLTLPSQHNTFERLSFRDAVANREYPRLNASWTPSTNESTSDPNFGRPTEPTSTPYYGRPRYTPYMTQSMIKARMANPMTIGDLLKNRMKVKQDAKRMSEDGNAANRKAQFCIGPSVKIENSCG